MLDSDDVDEPRKKKTKESEGDHREETIIEETRVVEEEIVVEPTLKKTSVLNKLPNPYILPVLYPGRVA